MTQTDEAAVVAVSTTDQDSDVQATGSADLQDFDSSSELIAFSSDLTRTLSDVQSLTFDGSTAVAEVFKSSLKALSLIRDRISDLLISSTMPSHMHSLLGNTMDSFLNIMKVLLLVIMKVVF